MIEILKEFYEVRLDMYCKRKVYLEGHLAAEALKLESQARFLLEKIEGLLNFGERGVGRRRRRRRVWLTVHV